MQINRFHWVGLRLLICFVAAFDININGHWYLLEKAFKSPMFYVAFVSSFGICYVLLVVIHRININLNAKFPWTRNWSMRFFRQISDGFLLPASVDFILMLLYFVLTGKVDKIDEYIYYEYRRVLHFIGAINLLYIVIFYILSVISSKKLDEQVLIIKHNGVNINLNVATDVLFAYKYGRKTMVCTISGKRYPTTDTISKLKAAYQSEGLFQVNPSALINLRMLTGHEPGVKLKTLTPLFKPQVQDKISSSNREKLVVTRNFMSGFKKEMEKYRTAHVQIEDGLRQLP